MNAKEQYLQKYIRNNASGSKKMRKRKKKAADALPVKKIAKSTIVDADNDWKAYAPKSMNAKDNGSEDEEDTPVMIDEQEIQRALGKKEEKKNRSNRGSWCPQAGFPDSSRGTC